MQKIRKQIVEDRYILTELLDAKSLQALNNIFNTHYKRPRYLKNRDKTTGFFRKLMRQKTGVR